MDTPTEAAPVAKRSTSVPRRRPATSPSGPPINVATTRAPSVSEAVTGIRSSIIVVTLRGVNSDLPKSPRSAEPVDVLLDERTIESELFAQHGDPFGRGVLPGDRHRRVAGDEERHAGDDHRHDQQEQRDAQQTGPDHLQHRSLPW